jgi:hypothetical protein
MGITVPFLFKRVLFLPFVFLTQPTFNQLRLLRFKNIRDSRRSDHCCAHQPINAAQIFQT